MRTRFLLSGFVALALVCGPSAAEATVSANIVGSTLQIVGDASSEAVTLRLLFGTPDQLQVMSGPSVVAFARSGFTAIVVDMGGGDDWVVVDETNGVFTDTEITTITGGDGLDTIHGGTGAETIFGGPGNDLLWGEGGNDSVSGGDGDDQVIWDPGDGVDTVDGDAGADTLVFNGSAAAEIVTLSAAGARTTLTRDIGAIVLNVGTTETLSPVPPRRRRHVHRRSRPAGAGDTVSPRRRRRRHDHRR